jgi:hypothetical protein
MQEVERKAAEQRNNKTDSLLRGEIDRLQRELCVKLRLSLSL